MEEVTRSVSVQVVKPSTVAKFHAKFRTSVSINPLIMTPIKVFWDFKENLHEVISNTIVKHHIRDFSKGILHSWLNVNYLECF